MRYPLRLADRSNGLEVEDIEGLAGRRRGFGKMVFEAAAALCCLVFRRGGGEARRRPALLVGLGGSEAQTGGSRIIRRPQPSA